jgi:hypothetical protein
LHTAIWDAIPTVTGSVCLVANHLFSTILMKTDLSGNVQSATSLELFSYLHMYSQAPKLHPITDGGFAFRTSTSFGPGYLVRTDSSLSTLFARELWVDPSDLAETPDGGLVILGNGPLMGVDMSPTLNPQIGLMLTDSLGNSPDCMTDMPCNTTSLTLSMSPVAFTSAAAGFPAVSAFPATQPALLSIFDGCVAVTGRVKENRQELFEMEISPNPSEGRFTITRVKPPAGTFVVFNMQGGTVFNGTFPVAAEFSVDLTSLPSGIYSFRAQTQQGILIRKIVIQH